LKTEIVVLAMLIGSAVGCGGSSQSSSAASPAGSSASGASLSASLAGAPAWATSDCRKHFDRQNVICGVGTVSGVGSPSLARNAAMGRGRTEIARLLQVRVKSILKDNQSVSGGKTDQVIEESSKQITDLTLSGTRMAEYWISPDGTYYALMTLGLDDFRQSVSHASAIDEPIRTVVLENAAKAFAAFDDAIVQH
jgi:hypothetical protein